MSIDFRLQVIFYKTDAGNAPVREWLKSMLRDDGKISGEDIKTAQFGWPLGMPLVRKLDVGLWEVRSRLDNRIARVLFTVEENVMVLCTRSSKNPKRHPQVN
jgi:hypothetical protein